MNDFCVHLSIIVRLTKTLWSKLKKGKKRTWILMLLRLIGFTLILLPGFIKMVYYWCTSHLIIRNISFGLGSKHRNLLDVYLPRISSSFPQKKPNNVPVIIFVSGGAWIIGYKLWSALCARGLSALGYVVVCCDYRNYPQGDVEDMLDDIRGMLLTNLSIYFY